MSEHQRERSVAGTRPCPEADNVEYVGDPCNPAMREEYLFTVQEFAEHVRMHEESVRRLCRENKIRHIRIGAQIRIPSGVLRDYIGGR